MGGCGGQGGTLPPQSAPEFCLDGLLLMCWKPGAEKDCSVPPTPGQMTSSPPAGHSSLLVTLLIRLSLLAGLPCLLDACPPSSKAATLSLVLVSSLCKPHKAAYTWFSERERV